MQLLEGCAAFGGFCGCAFSIHLLLLATAGTSFVYDVQCTCVLCPGFHTVEGGGGGGGGGGAEHEAVVCADKLHKLFQM